MTGHRSGERKCGKPARLSCNYVALGSFTIQRKRIENILRQLSTLPAARIPAKDDHSVPLDYIQNLLPLL